MPPLCQSFPANDLPQAVQLNWNGRLRKTEDVQRIDLFKDCELLGLVQYECLVSRPEVPESPIQCWPIQRLFRRGV